MESTIADKAEILAKREWKKIKEQLNRETAQKNMRTVRERLKCNVGRVSIRKKIADY